MFRHHIFSCQHRIDVSLTKISSDVISNRTFFHIRLIRLAKLQIKIISLPTDYSDHPRYNVAKRSNPYDAHQERDGKPILKSGFFAVGDRAHEYKMNGPCCDPSGLP